MKLDDALKNVALVAFDTSPIIYFVEANPHFDALITEIFRRVDNGEIFGLTPVISLCEVLVHPIRQQNQILKQGYIDILQNSPHFFTESTTPPIAETAAGPRAKYNLRTPDTLQLAAALEYSCNAFSCSDRDLNRVTELKILSLTTSNYNA